MGIDAVGMMSPLRSPMLAGMGARSCDELYPTAQIDDLRPIGDLVQQRCLEFQQSRAEYQLRLVQRRELTYRRLERLGPAPGGTSTSTGKSSSTIPTTSGRKGRIET